MKFASKQALLQSIEKEHAEFLGLASAMPRSRWREAGVWGDGWNVKDLLAHLTEWERMFLRWFREGGDGGTPSMPAPGYGWNQTPALNREIRRRHANRPLEEVQADFDASYAEILALVRSLPEEDLLTAGRLAWTGRYPLTSYLAPNTCNHYRAASKILRRWKRADPGGRARAAPRAVGGRRPRPDAHR